MVSNSNYRFRLSVGGGAFQTVKPLPVEGLNLESTQQPEQQFLRDKLSTTLLFSGSEAMLLFNASIEDVFLLRVERQQGNIWAQEIEVEFFKTDCKFIPNGGGESQAQVRVSSFETLDNYDKFLQILNKEINIFDATPKRTTVHYQKRAVIQIAFPGSEFIGNYTNGFYWETPCTPITTQPDDHESMYHDYFFGYGKDGSGQPDWIFGVMQNVNNTLSPDTPDISGVYYCRVYFGNGNWGGQGVGFKHVSKDLWLDYNTESPPRVVVRDAAPGDPGSVLFQGEQGANSVNSPYHNSNGVILDCLASADKCKFYAFKPYVRLLTDKVEVNGQATFELPTDDPFSGGLYTRALPIETQNFAYSGEHQAAATYWPKITDLDLQAFGRYLKTPTVAGLDEQLLPVIPSTWNGAGAWFWLDNNLRALLSEGAVDYQTEGIKLVDGISAMLDYFDTGLTHEENATYSNFLYSNSNSIRGLRKIPVIVPISNILIGNYEQPASKALIRFNDLLQLFANFHKCYPYIDRQSLKFEHWQFFDNGYSYAGEQVGTDTTGLKNPQANKAWNVGQDSFEYDKQDMPERIESGWAVDCSRPFVGHPIDILSRFVQKGDVKDGKIGRFVSDLDFVLTAKDKIPQDGIFMFFECLEYESGGGVYVPFVELEISPTERYLLQNGYASFFFAHSQYWPYGLPAENVRINTIETTAESVERGKRQVVSFPLSGDLGGTLEKRKLVQTSEGNGRIVSAKRNLESGFVEVTLKHKIQ